MWVSGFRHHTLAGLALTFVHARQDFMHASAVIEQALQRGTGIRRIVASHLVFDRKNRHGFEQAVLDLGTEQVRYPALDGVEPLVLVDRQPIGRIGRNNRVVLHIGFPLRLPESLRQ